MVSTATRLKRIRRYVDGEREGVEFTSLFSTKEGKRLGRQLTDLMGFVASLSFLNMPIALIQREWIRLYKEGKMEELKEYSNTDEGFDDMEQLLDILSRFTKNGEEDDHSKVIGEKEIRRLLALLTLSTSAYLDAYLSEIAVRVKGAEPLVALIEEYLCALEVVNRRNFTKVETPEQVWSLGSNQLVEVLYSALKVAGVCEAHFTQTEVSRYTSFFTFFVRLRGKIVHGDPAPSLRRFDHNIFSETRDELNREFLGGMQWSSVPEPLRPIIEIVRSWFLGNLKTLSVIFTVPLLVVFPICLLDLVIWSRSR